MPGRISSGQIHHQVGRENFGFKERNRRAKFCHPFSISPNNARFHRKSIFLRFAPHKVGAVVAVNIFGDWQERIHPVFGRHKPVRFGKINLGCCSKLLYNTMATTTTCFFRNREIRKRDGGDHDCADSADKNGKPMLLPPPAYHDFIMSTIPLPQPKSAESAWLRPVDPRFLGPLGHCLALSLM